MNYDLRVLSLGEMIGRAFNLYFDNFPAFVSISLLSKLPLFVYLLIFLNPEMILWLYGMGITDQSVLQVILVGGMVVFSLFCQYIETGIIINIVSKRYLNQSVDFRNTVSETLSFLLPLFGLSFLLLISISAGFMLLLAPAFIFTTGFALSTQILIVEKKSIIASMKRSWQLTNGIKLKIFGYMILIGLMVGIPNQVATGVLQELFKVIGLSDTVWSIIAITGISALVSPVQDCFNVLLYYNVRIEKEGFALEHLAEEFSLANAERPTDADM
jgi:hypothetical protein